MCVREKRKLIKFKSGSPLSNDKFISPNISIKQIENHCDNSDLVHAFTFVENGGINLVYN